ncbi:MAG: hypothetical protein ACRELV_17250 [Longimicrobiales bacterium]
MKRLGVVGTMVWDRIHARDRRQIPVEEWGGIAYALAALTAAMPDGWDVVPLIKIGEDLRHRAVDFLGDLPGLDLARGTRFVPEPNNRVELRYLDSERRCERLSGGVPSWSWPELEPLVHDLDALYINFISGWELDLETAVRLRLGFRGPIYADLHSLFMGVARDGMRTPQPLDRWREWLRCFDVVQVNEDELGLLADAWGDPWRFAAEVVGHELRLLLVTLGGRGAAYVASSALTRDPLTWHPHGIGRIAPLAAAGTIRSEKIALDAGDVADGDPTGSGDVWGATCFVRLLAGAELPDAMRTANAAAARNVRHRGATGLHHHLKGRIGT